MKKLFALLIFVSTFAFGQTYPNPILSNYPPTVATIAALQAATTATFPQAQVSVAGFAAAGDAGGGVFALGANTTANGCTIFNDASGRSWYRQTSGNIVNVKWCGAKGDGSTNDTTAFVNAVAVGKTVFAPDGLYNVTEGSIVLQFGQSLNGAGEATYVPAGPGPGTVIRCTTNAGAACITVASNSNWVTISNLTVVRSAALGTLASGSNGIQFNGLSSFCNVFNVLVYNNYVGLLLRDTGAQGYVTNFVAQSNTSHGVELQNLAAGSLQWVLNNILSQSNGGDGYLITSINGNASSSVSVSNMSELFSFANTGPGFAVIGSALQPIYGPRLSNSFFGQDGNDEVLFNGFGGDVQITDSFFELSGSTATGPLGTTPASNAGSGIEIDNGTNIKISNNIVASMSIYGIYLAGGTAVAVTGNTVVDNGMNGASAGYGIYVAAGAVADITGNTVHNTLANTSQKVGVNNAGTIAVFSGNNLLNNATAGYTGTNPTDSCGTGYTCNFNQPVIVGTTNGTSAVAGAVGEYLTATGTATSIAANTTSGPGSINLSAGDWDVQATVALTPAGTTTLASSFIGISPLATALAAFGTYIETPALTQTGGTPQVWNTPVVRVNVSTTTAYFAVVNSNFGVSTCTATVFLRARRVH